jgi:hypothetical protein
MMPINSTTYTKDEALALIKTYLGNQGRDVKEATVGTTDEAFLTVKWQEKERKPVRTSPPPPASPPVSPPPPVVSQASVPSGFSGGSGRSSTRSSSGS